MRNSTNHERGQALITVMVVSALALLAVAGLANSTAVSMKTRAVVNEQSNQYYDAETVLANVAAWLQANSKNLVFPFKEENFSMHLAIGAPAVGTNEGEHFETPTMVKGLGEHGSKSIMLSTHDSFGKAYFPPTRNIDSGDEWDAVQAFRNADFGGDSNARVVLVWARETAGNYEPVYRIDVINGNNPDRGAHVFSYVYSTLVVPEANGAFYGRDRFKTVTPNNTCKSYQYSYSGPTWVRGADRSNCVVASNEALILGSRINGNALTLLDEGIEYTKRDGVVTGEACMGASCHAISLAAVNPWASACPAHQGDLTVNSATTLQVGGPAPGQRCWRDVSVRAGRILTLRATNDEADPATEHLAFHFRRLDIANNASLRFENMPPGKKVTLFVEEFAGNMFNGNQVLNLNNSPSQVVLNITGPGELKLNGTAVIQAAITAPLKAIEVLGNFNYYGSIHALTLDVSGNATLNADESANAPELTDMRFGARKASLRYR